MKTAEAGKAKGECLKALKCLYLELPESIVNDVKEKVISALHEQFLEGKKEGIELMRDACMNDHDEFAFHLNSNSIRRIAEEEILKLKTV